MTENHASWLTSLPANIRLLEGDPDAMQAIRTETGLYNDQAIITPNSPIFLWDGAYLRDERGEIIEVPEITVRRHIQRLPFPADPIARSSDERPVSKRDALMKGSIQAEGDLAAMEAVILATRLYYEIAEGDFPIVILRWFSDGLYCIGPGSEPKVFQVPMNRVEEFVMPRIHPLMPYLRKLG